MSINSSNIKNNAIRKIRDKIKKQSSRPGFFKKGKPFFKLGNEIGILLIHGFDDTAYIMQEYANFFVRKGFTIYNTTLCGRGFTPEEFAKTRYQEWVLDAKESYLTLKKTVMKIFIAGFSTGATIAMNLCGTISRKDLPDGVILLSPAIFIANPIIPITLGLMIVRLLKKINPFPKKLNNRHLIFFDPVARKKYDNLERSSFQGVIEILKLIKETKRVVKNITTPFLTVHSKKDIVISNYSSKWIYNKTKSSLKEYLKLKNSGHPVMVDVEKRKVFTESYKFILEVLNN
jgi:carboxylesterase